MHKIVDRIVDALEDNPALVLAAVGALFTGIAKFGAMLIQGKNARTWRREVRRRERRYA